MVEPIHGPILIVAGIVGLVLLVTFGQDYPSDPNVEALQAGGLFVAFGSIIFGLVGTAILVVNSL